MNAALLSLLLFAQDDTSEAARVVVQHEARGKPFDTFARQFMQFLTEKERFSRYRGPDGREVVVFPTDDPVFALLKMIAQPGEVRELRFIKITHPGLKKTFGLDENLTYYSLADLQPLEEKFMEIARTVDPEDATTEQRAVLKIISQFRQIQALHRERLLTIIPIPFGKENGWMTPADVRPWLAGVTANDSRSMDTAAALEKYVGSSGDRRQALQAVIDHWTRAVAAFANGDLALFKGLADELRALNPRAYPPEERVQTELRYNRFNPFHWVSYVLFIAVLLYLMAIAFESKRVGWIAWSVVTGAVGLMVYGGALRWQIADRVPLSNHYESMMMCGLAACVLTSIIERFMRAPHVVGLAGSIVAFILVTLANTVPAFAEQGFVAPLVPALQSFWMKIHVPIIMSGFAMGMVLAVLGHIHFIRIIFGKADAAWVAKIDRIMYRVLQVCVLKLLIGIILGAVWAGEAWGRPWGWDMKETWALITLLCYLATLHARFVGILKPFSHSFCSLISFQILILTYYGVNFLFGKGLHTYGFGSGDWFYLTCFFVFEALLLGVATAVHMSRGAPPAPAGDPYAMRTEE